MQKASARLTCVGDSFTGGERTEILLRVVTMRENKNNCKCLRTFNLGTFEPENKN